jgi:Right handed beta helix region
LEVASGAHVDVRGLTILHNSPSVANNYAIYVQPGAQLELTNCDVNSASGAGIGVDGGTLSLADCYVHDCVGNGIVLAGDMEGHAGSARLEGSRVAYCASVGIVALDGSELSMERSKVLKNKKAGIDLRVRCLSMKR